MAKKVTYDDITAIDKKIDALNEEISELLREGASDDVLEEKYIQLGRAIIGKDLAEERIKADMTEEELKAYDKLTSIAERQKQLERRIGLMEKELEETLSTKAALDETIANGERVMDLIDKTIKAVEQQAATFS